MTTQDSFLENIWDSLLSRDPKKINTVYESLDYDSQQTALNHLKRMTSEEGWHPEQNKSAAIALETLKKAGIISNGH
ncbi:MAG: hypothetical protein FD147_1294 [Chloroflexi bacterium]|nr:MAG: hypothetical protein FD147_1294 [Chloroflexota bacterium]MBA4375490.1 hypothetical protein [Anaerolinea sp.]